MANTNELREAFWQALQAEVRAGHTGESERGEIRKQQEQEEQWGEVAAIMTSEYYASPSYRPSSEYGAGQREATRRLQAKLELVDKVRFDKVQEQAKEKQATRERETEQNKALMTALQEGRTIDALTIPRQEKDVAGVEAWGEDMVEGKVKADCRTWNHYLWQYWREHKEELDKERAAHNLEITLEGRTHKSTFVDLYVNGKLGIRYAIETHTATLTYGHHLKRLMATRDDREFTRTLNELGAAGVNLNRLMIVMKQQEGRNQGKGKGEQIPQVTVKVVKGNAVVEVKQATNLSTAPSTLVIGSQEWEIREAERAYDEAQEVKQMVAKVREKGYSVVMTEQEKASILKQDQERKARQKAMIIK